MHTLAMLFAVGFVLFAALGLVVAAVAGPETAQAAWALSILCFMATSVLAVLDAIF